MNIGIDTRMYGLKHAGIGRYVMNLVDRLIQIPAHQWTLFIPTDIASQFKSNSNIKLVPTDIRHYSLSEQTNFLSVLNRESLDLLHVPHFNVPYLYRRPFVVTIHDILWHQVRGADVTTLSPLKYYLKYQGYKLTVAHAVGQSKAIIVPSNYVKQDLLNVFPKIKPAKIHVTYEGVSLSNHLDSPKSSTEAGPFLLYVGSAYPHKNLEVLLQALTKLELPLIIVGSRSVFLDRVRSRVGELGLTDRVEFLGSLPDAQLTELYRTAIALVHPSKSEGFGLTGLEAMAAGCPVIAAEATALPEIYGSAALYFDPDDSSALVSQILNLTEHPELRQSLIRRGQLQAEQYSWDKMVHQTVELYEKIAKPSNKL